jgi:transcription elongation factor GreA
MVGEDEADIKAHRISINSPIARGLIGKQEGDAVTIRTPAGEKQFEIMEVKYE